MNPTRVVSLLVAACFFFACGDATGLITDDEFGAASSELIFAPGNAEKLLAVANYPGTDLAALDSRAGLDSRAAAGMLAHRNGADGLALTADDDLFDTIAELDAVPYVGDVAFKKLLAYAEAHPAPAGETVEGVSFRGWESELVVWGVNTGTQGTLDALMDARASQNLIARRPFASVTQMGPLGYVGPSALERLRKEASSWWKLRLAGPVTTLAEVQASLTSASAGIWFPSETDAHIVVLAGTQLNGAAITVAAIRAQFTVQHDQLIETVMYTDVWERSLAAKTLVEIRSENDFLGRIITNVDPGDDVSVANVAKISNLKAVLEANLTDLMVVRFGRISISTFIVGRAPTGELVALLTGQVET